MSRKVCQPPGGPDRGPTAKSPKEPSGDFEEVVRGYTAAEARTAAQRCLATYACTYCEVCELLCPDQCITRDPASGEIHIDLNHCKGCGLCAHFCPKGAIRMEAEPAG